MGRDGIEHFTSDRDADLREIQEQLACNAQTSVDFVRAVEIGVIDQTFPADRRAWLFKVCTHYDDKAVFPALLVCLVQAARVLFRLVNVVDRAWANNDQQTIVFATNHTCSLIAATGDRRLRLFAHRQFMHQQGWRHERLVARHARVIRVGHFCHAVCRCVVVRMKIGKLSACCRKNERSDSNTRSV